MSQNCGSSAGSLLWHWVLPLTMVDNSSFSPNRLTVHSDSPYDKHTIPAIHFKQRGF